MFWFQNQKLYQKKSICGNLVCDCLGEINFSSSLEGNDVVENLFIYPFTNFETDWMEKSLNVSISISGKWQLLGCPALVGRSAWLPAGLERYLTCPSRRGKRSTVLLCYKASIWRLYLVPPEKVINVPNLSLVINYLSLSVGLMWWSMLPKLLPRWCVYCCLMDLLTASCWR